MIFSLKRNYVTCSFVFCFGLCIKTVSVEFFCEDTGENYFYISTYRLKYEKYRCVFGTNSVHNQSFKTSLVILL